MLWTGLRSRIGLRRLRRAFMQIIMPPGRALAAGIPGANFLEMSDAAHGLPVQHAERVSALLAEHIARAESVGTSRGAVHRREKLRDDFPRRSQRRCRALISKYWLISRAERSSGRASTVRTPA